MTQLDDMQPRYDVVVVGARAAGAATSLLLARAGLRVLALDRSAYGSDTLSTHALLSTGVLQLARFGLLDAVRATGAPALRMTLFQYGAQTVPIAFKPRYGVDGLYAPRRTSLDRLLVDAAREAGADVRHQLQMTDLLRDAAGRVRGVCVLDEAGCERSVSADLVIGADGMKSSVARLVQADVLRAGHHAASTIYAYFPRVFGADAYRWYFNGRVSAGVIPTEGGLDCVFVVMPPARYRAEVRTGLPSAFRSVLSDASPELASVLSGVPPLTRYCGFEGRHGALRQAHGPGWALVGDAGYFKDPATAHGLSDALRDAELLASAVLEGGFDAFVSYQEQRDALSLRFFDLGDEMASCPDDLLRLQQLHIGLSEEIGKEFRVMGERVVRTSRAA